MKAILWTRYGPPDVLQLGEVEKPAPKDNELLVRIHATTVTAGDCGLRGLTTLGPFWLPMRLYVGLVRPTRIRTLSQELAGEIEAVGKDVTLFEQGDQRRYPLDQAAEAHRYVESGKKKGNVVITVGLHSVSRISERP